MLTSDLALIVASALFFGLCVAIAWSDMRHRRIPNRFILLLILGAPLLLIGGQMTPKTMAASFALALCLFFVGSQLFARGWIGGGDVKLICALVLWFPPGPALWFVYLALLFGGVLALIVLVLRLAARRGLVTIGSAQRRLLEETLCVPYGVSICAAAAVSFITLWF
ncbi:prepilin peptidase [uncultured Roseobacter sp.]|uniref:A24 family peptidase n=1 Tax=uncultured Roseobacter sp. TaxID=114847 RepID=UPI0026123622|nr:prepilin peptidase [uncultured Roseobacter sp.]